MAASHVGVYRQMCGAGRDWVREKLRRRGDEGLVVEGVPRRGVAVERM